MFRVLNTRFISQRPRVILNQNFTAAATGKGNGEAPQSSGPSIPDVQGVTDKVVKIPNQPVGFAGASKDKEYKNPEYFCYHVDSFADAFVEMEKFRLPAPSNKKKRN